MLSVGAVTLSAGKAMIPLETAASLAETASDLIEVVANLAAEGVILAEVLMALLELRPNLAKVEGAMFATAEVAVLEVVLAALLLDAAEMVIVLEAVVAAMSLMVVTGAPT